MNTVISFKDSFLPKKIKKYLDDGQWEQIERIITQGVPLDLKMDTGESFWEGILYAFHKKHPSKRGHAPQIPEKLQKTMVKNIPKGFLRNEKMKKHTSVTISSFYGQWGLVDKILHYKEMGGELEIDSYEYSVWSAVMDGYLHRVGIKNYRYPNLEKDTYVSIVAKRVCDDEREKLIYMFKRMKNHAKQWPDKNDGNENFFILTSIMTFQDHVLQAFLKNGVDPDCISYFENSEGLQISNRTPIFSAIEVGNLDAVKTLVNYNCSWVNEFFNESGEIIETMSLLEWACECENNEMLSSIMMLGGRKNNPFIKRTMKIAINKDNLILLKNICKNGGDLLEGDNDGNTLLHVAAVRGNEKIINWLLKNGHEWWKENKYGVAPYHVLHHYQPQKLKKWNLPHNKNYNVVSIKPF